MTLQDTSSQTSNVPSHVTNTPSQIQKDIKYAIPINKILQVWQPKHQVCHPNKKYANQNTKYTNQSTKYTKQNTKYANQNTKYANKNNKYAIIKTTNTSTKRPSTPAKTPKKTPSTPIKTPNTPTKTPSTPVKNTDLRCLVAGQFLSRIYALFWCTIFKGLKMRWCTKKDKYEVCSETFEKY